MNVLPTPEEVHQLLKSLFDVSSQRIDQLRGMATLYQVTGTPLQCLSKTVFQVRNGKWGQTIYIIEKASGKCEFPISPDAGWTTDDFIEFLEYFEQIRELYAEDVDRAYNILRRSPMWVSAK